MAKAVNPAELHAVFEKHVGETQGQADCLIQVFKLLEERPKGKTCPAMLGLVEESEQVMDDFEDSPAFDAGLLAGAQAVEHYEIARCGTLIAWVQQLGMKEAATLLSQTLVEEEKADKTLSGLAESIINQQGAPA